MAPWSRNRLKKIPGGRDRGALEKKSGAGAGAAKKLGAGARAAWEKKSGAGAGAAKKLAGSLALLEDKKHKEIVLLLLFFFMFVWIKTNYFNCFRFFAVLPS